MISASLGPLGGRLGALLGLFWGPGPQTCPQRSSECIVAVHAYPRVLYQGRPWADRALRCDHHTTRPRHTTPAGRRLGAS
eukprot:2459607-Pyramimonas_sp.AAC.1